MAHLRLAVALMMATMLAGATARAQEEYDNPRDGSTPCIVLNSYAVEPVRSAAGGTAYQGEAAIENLCGRAMEVSFCFLQIGGDDASAETCYAGPVRPWASARVEEPGAAERISGAEYRWRYLE